MTDKEQIINNFAKDITVPCNEQKNDSLKNLDKNFSENPTQEKEQIILDACCGSRMFHFNKENPNVIFMDNRDIEDTLCDGRKLKVHPDIVADFRSIPFKDNSFSLVIFDPPHLIKVGESSYLYKKYGKLQKTWPSDIKKGFDECMRVLKPRGTLIFKWSTRNITLKQILDVIRTRPIIYHKNNNTFFLVFMKGI